MIGEILTVKTRRFIILALAMALSLGLIAQPAQAATISGNFIELFCSGLTILSDATITLDRDNTGNNEEHISFLVTDGFGTSLATGAIWGTLGAGVSLDSDFYGDYASAPQGNPITLRMVSDAGNGLPREVLVEFTIECEGLPWVTQPSYPAEFQQRVITCDVPVYNAPGGTPVGENMLKAGQTWHVNPTPVDGPDGQPWTEVFVGGWQRPFIPTACVG